MNTRCDTYSANFIPNRDLNRHILTGNNAFQMYNVIEVFFFQFQIEALGIVCGVR